MDISVKQSNQTSIVSIGGSIDASNANQIVVRMDELISSGRKQFVVDLSEVGFMSSAGLRAILNSLKKIRHQGGDLYLAGARGAVSKLLSMSGISKVLKTFDSADSAIAKSRV